MAQTQTVLDEGIVEYVILMSDTTPAATALTKIVALTDSTTCTAAVGSTFANPAGTATHAADNGFAIAAADSVTQSQTNGIDDTIEVDHVFTASGAKNIVGFHLCNNDGDVSFMECCENAVLAMATSDTYTIEAKQVLNQA